MSRTATASHPPEPEQQPPLLEVDIEGGRVRLRTRYDPQLVERLRRLPGRRFIPKLREWVLPASRAALAALAGRLAELGGTRSSASRRGGASSAKAPGGSTSTRGSSS
jgi:hypothetical protein